MKLIKTKTAYDISQVGEDYLREFHKKIIKETDLSVKKLVESKQDYYVYYDPFFGNKWVLKPKSNFKIDKIIKLLDYQEYDFVIYKCKNNYSKLGFYIKQLNDIFIIETQKGKIITTKSVIKKID